MIECTCKGVRPTRRKMEDGTVRVWLQCPACGRAPRAVRMSDYDVSQLPDFDPDLQGRVWREQRQTWTNEREKAQAVWWTRYNRYLNSEAWASLRYRVLDRDRHLCQSCLLERASQVHHLSYELYDRTGSSAAFECVAICEPCHRRIHPHMADAQGGRPGRKEAA